MSNVLGCALALSSIIAGSGDAEVAAHYKTFESPSLHDTGYDEVRHHLLQGRPFVVTDGARGLPMASWDCNFVKQQFPSSRIRQEGGSSEVNGVKMKSDWIANAKPYADGSSYPEGAPRIRPFYWDIAKAWRDEKHRKWGKDPQQVVDTLVTSTAMPYWLPKQSTEEMGYSSEMWFHPQGAGARAHMDPHCKTTVSFCFSGHRKWRMMVPPAEPHPDGYFDGEVYGVRNPSRRGEWQPTFELDAPNGSAVVVYPGMVHETLSTGEECSSSISQTFEVPTPAAYFRAFWPRFALVGEDVAGCGHVVEALTVLGSRTRVQPGAAEAARKAGRAFAAKVDSDGDGLLSDAEIQTMSNSRHSLEELKSFHDVDQDGQVSIMEVEESWVMLATANHRAAKRMKGEL